MSLPETAPASTLVNAYGASHTHEPPYTLALARHPTEPQIAAAASDHTVALRRLDAAAAHRRQHLVADDALACANGGPAHRGRINDLAYGPPHAPTLFSAGSDAAVRGWDARTRASSAAAVLTFTTQSAGLGREEVWSVSASTGQLVAAGTQSAVLVWDVRSAARPLHRFEVHTEAVSAVRFQPGSPTTLLSGSVDGLLCAIDCTQADEDSAVTSIYNTEAPVASLGFFGDAPSAQVYVLSSVETLSVWNLQHSGACVARFDAIIRTPADDDGGGPAPEGVDYLVGCAYDEAAARLYLLAGEHSGTLHVLAVEPGALTVLSTLKGGPTSGHTADVRCCCWSGDALVTGGEDARLCLWSAAGGSDAAAAPRSNKGSALKVARAGGGAARAAPY